MAGGQIRRMGFSRNLRSALARRPSCLHRGAVLNHSTHEESSSMASSLFRSVAAHSVIALSTALCVGQAPTGPTAAVDVKSLSYEVASVKPDHSKELGTWWRTTSDGFSANVAVLSLIKSAYGIVMDDQISGLPGWADTDQFDVEAKMDADTMAAIGKLSKDERAKQRQLMLQAVLAERFNLKVHEETREPRVYALTVAKGGPKFKESSKSGISYSMGMGTLKGSGIEMASLGFSLSGRVGRLIVDKTGLTGKYDIDLKWAMDDDPGAGDS